MWRIVGMVKLIFAKSSKNWIEIQPMQTLILFPKTELRTSTEPIKKAQSSNFKPSFEHAYFIVNSCWVKSPP